jgi:hypothetical protein
LSIYTAWVEYLEELRDFDNVVYKRFLGYSKTRLALVIAVTRILEIYDGL